MDEGLAKRLYEGVRRTYSAVAEKPSESHPFPVGRTFAESIGYPKTLLKTLPALSVDAFAGLSNVSLYAEIPEGSIILDLGCGAGLDTFIAARRTGPAGRVIGIDFSGSMLDRARQALRETDFENVEFKESPAERLPLRAGEIDVVIVNGIFNLNPNREAIFSELARVIRPNGHVYASELILIKSIVNPTPSTEAEWFA